MFGGSSYQNSGFSPLTRVTLPAPFCIKPGGCRFFQHRIKRDEGARIRVVFAGAEVWLSAVFAGTAVTWPRLYGLTDATSRRSLAVMEVPRTPPPEDLRHTPQPGRLSDVYDYVLTSTVYAANLLASWSIRSIPATATVGGRPPRVVDHYFHPAGGQLERLRVEVRGNGAGARISMHDDDTPPDPREYDQTAFADHLHALIRRSP